MTHRYSKYFVVTKALVRKGNTFLILKKSESRASPLAGWETPGGHLDGKELPLEGLAREIREETRLTVRLLYPFGTFGVPAEREGESSLVGINYLAEWISGEPELSDEHAECRWATIAEIRALVESRGLQKEMDRYENFLKIS